MAGPDREHLDALVAGLEGTDDLGRDADRVEGLDLDDLVVELDPPGTANDDVDLLRLFVPMAKGGALAWLRERSP